MYPYEQFDEGDELLVSGRIISEDGYPFVSRLPCMAATVYGPECSAIWVERGYQDVSLYEFKVWPTNDHDPQLPANHDGKLWFDFRDPLTRVEVTMTDFPDDMSSSADASSEPIH